MKFNADEVFEMAEQIERNGAEFYSKAAQKFFDEKIRNLFLSLAKMEKEHEATFAKMRQQFLPEEQKKLWDPNGEAVAYLRVFVDDVVFREDPCKYLENLNSVKEVLEKAIALEKDSIAFYVGIQEIVPEDWGRHYIQEIIREEKKHVILLDMLLEK